MAAGTSGSAVRVLVVEDDDAVRRVVALALRGAGIEVIQARDGESALAAFRERAADIDCALLDLGLPGMSGGETFDALLEIRGDLPIVVATGSLEDDALDALQSRGARGVLRKPASIDEIVEAIRGAMAAPPSGAS